MAIPADLHENTTTLKFYSPSTGATINLGKIFGSQLSAGDVVVLTGDLGAGKTQLTKGIAQGLDITDDVTSPTFTIEMVYEGPRMPLYHFDLYRLNDPEQLEDTGLYDVLDSDGPCIIEWGEQFSDEIGANRVDVWITRNDDDTPSGMEPARTLVFRAHSKKTSDLLNRFSCAFDEKVSEDASSEDACRKM